MGEVWGLTDFGDVKSTSSNSDTARTIKPFHSKEKTKIIARCSNSEVDKCWASTQSALH